MKRYNRKHVGTVFGFLIFGLVVLVGVMFFAGFWTLSSTYNVSAYVPNARGLAQDSTVFEAGLPVGLVTGVHRNGPDAILSLRITGGPRPLPIDTTIQLGLRSLAGEADVLLFPGRSSQTIRSGGSLQLAQDEGYTEVDQILQDFAGHTTATTRQFFQGLGGGLKGQGRNLNGTLGGFAALVNDSPPLTSTIAAQKQQVADIVQNFGNIMEAIGQRTQALSTFARGSVETFDTIAANDAQFKQTLDNLHTVFVATRALSNSLYLDSPTIDPVLANLGSALSKLSPTINELTPASRKGIQVLDALGTAAPQLKNVLANLTALKPSATSALTSLKALTCQVNPMVRYIAPYGSDFAAFFEDFGAADDPYDYNHQILVSANVDPTHFFRGVDGAKTSAALQELINIGIFHNILGAKTGYNPNDGPGGIGRTNVDVGVDGPGQVAQNASNPPTNTFPHVTADCASTLPGGFHIG
jgi:phospholipid/cholesterol/gamma-HCH transport system substrate-binding protein